MTPEDAFDKYHQAICRFAYRLTRRVDIAEDITQDCFLAFLRVPDRFDPGRGSLKTYLFAIARNLALKDNRDNHRHEEVDFDQQSVAADPPQSMEISQAVECAIAELPPLQREALILFEYEGFMLEEIAQVTGADAGTIKSRLHRARERLRRTLAPYKGRLNAHGRG
jgi:RNA polymerase sigma-70 factor (ECF subfamily)